MSISLIPFDSHIECMTIDTETTGLDPAGGDEILTLARVSISKAKTHPRRFIYVSCRSIRRNGPTPST